MRSIRHQVLIVLVAACLLPAVVILWVTNQITGDALERSEYAKLKAVGGEMARQVAASMEANQSSLETLRTNSIVNNLNQPLDKRVEEMGRLVNAYQRFDDITLYDPEGFMLASTTTGSHPETDEKTGWFETARDTKKVVLSLPHRVNGLNGLHLKVYIPLVREPESGETVTHELPHVLKARLSFDDTVANRIGGAQLGMGGFAVLIDPRGSALFHPDEEKVLSRFAPSWSATHWITSPKGIYVEPETQESFIYSANHISPDQTRVGENWTLVTFLPMSEVKAAVHESQQLQLLLGLIAVIIASIIGVWLSNRLAAPLVSTSEAAQQVAQGNLNAQLPDVGGSLEIQRLSSSFNQMIDEVRDHREGLELKVEERTRKFRDSEKRLAELTAQLRASYDSTQEAIMVVKTDGTVLTANRRFGELFELEDLHGKHVSKIENQIRECFSDQCSFSEHWTRCNDSLSLVEDEEWVVEKPKEMVLSIYSAPVKGDDGMTFARLWMFRDLTEQRQLENGLRQAQKMEAIGRLAGGVAHDFNNLLTGIIGNLSLVQMQKVPDQKQVDKLVASAKHAGKRAAELVKQLLGFSRQSLLKLESCVVSDIAEEVRDLLVHTIDPSIQIVLELNEDLWPVAADPNQVQQVMMNMAVNAKDAIGDNGRIRISTTNLEIDEFHASLVNDANPGDYVRLSVEDTGGGMSQEVKTKIFEPFFTTKEPGKGTGLGLATSYGIIQQHGGWIACESEEGVGTIFHVFLPKGDLPVKDEASTGKEEAVMGGTETVLLVDDELVVRMVGEGVLKHHGYKVVTAGDGVEALEKVRELGDQISVVMLDLTMPKLSGRETFKELRAGVLPHIPVVICSGYLVDLNQFEAETGSKPEGFVQKPYDSEELARTLRQGMDVRAALGT